MDGNMRPCVVTQDVYKGYSKDKRCVLTEKKTRSGRFHAWVNYARRMTSDSITTVYGLVEFEDGHMEFVKPGDIQFTDRGEEMKGKMMYCKFQFGGYAVRPKDWTGLFDSEGALSRECNVAALFTEESDAKEYCEMCNDPVRFASNTLREELLKHGDLWDGFVASIESALKESILPFSEESEIAEKILKQIVGEEERI